MAHFRRRRQNEDRQNAPLSLESHASDPLVLAACEDAAGAEIPESWGRDTALTSRERSIMVRWALFPILCRVFFQRLIIANVRFFRQYGLFFVVCPIFCGASNPHVDGIIFPIIRICYLCTTS